MKATFAPQKASKAKKFKEILHIVIHKINLMQLTLMEQQEVLLQQLEHKRCITIMD